MSHPKSPQPAKLVIGVLLADRTLLPAITDELDRLYGPVDLVSPWLDFDFTDYYRSEMGAPLYRRMLVYRRLIHQDRLAAVKLATNQLEQVYAVEGGRRRVNIDPGYLLLERFVLATGKNYSHRIYIGGRIYADLTLIYRDGAYRPLPWTYPDYAGEAMRAFLQQVRQIYAMDLKRACPGESCGDFREE